MNFNNPIIVWTCALLVTFMVFYGLDQFIMAAQGLPLNLDLTPAQ